MLVTTAIELLHVGAIASDWRPFVDHLIHGVGISYAEVNWDTPGLLGPPRLWSAARRPNTTLHAATQPTGDYRTLASADAALRLVLVAGNDISETQLSGLCARLEPTLTEVARMAASVEVRVRSVALEAIVAARRFPQFIVDGEATVVVCNDAAHRWLAATSRCTLTNNKLKLLNTFEGEGVLRQIRRLAADGKAEPGIVPLRNDNHAITDFVVITPCPVVPRGARLDGLAVVTWLSLKDLLAIAPTILNDALDLTPAEASIANALAAGASVAQYAVDANLAVATVRWHLHNAMQNSGTTSQIELARLTLALQLLTN